MSHPFNLDGKVALVTGGNTGLGQGMAVALAQAGADIVVAGPLQRGRDRQGRRSRRAAASSRSRADFSDPACADSVVAETVAKAGAIDILVNNAGIIRRNDALDFTEDDWDCVMDVNIKSLFFLCQAAAKRMIPAGGGKIINIASILSFPGRYPRGVLYGVQEAAWPG